ncbi:hypothetical protein C8Q77DRAFT_237448 [Trametes polyzona]|nr:hypothetical protein C8Q77DRAFT_237448 [Trametes polyzona]
MCDSSTLAARELPSKDEASSDAAALIRSVYSLVFVLVTSAAFRLILSDVLLIARETAADVAARVEEVAGVVERAAEQIEETVRPGGGTIEDVQATAGEVGQSMTAELSGEGPISGHLAGAAGKVKEESPDEVKEAVLRRLQEAMEQAHRNPSFQAALRTILSLLRKYAAKVRAATAVAHTAEAPKLEFTPVVWADPALARALVDLETLIERVASGNSLDPFLQALSAVIVDAVIVPTEALSESENKAALREWCASLGAWLDHALEDPAYAASEDGRRAASELYDAVRRDIQAATVDPDAEWLKHLRTLLDETDRVVSAVSQDRTTRHLALALSSLTEAFVGAGSTALSAVPRAAQVQAEQVRRKTLKSAVLWLVPRLLRVVSAIPMPRVEYVDDALEVAVDALLLTAPRRKRRTEVLGVQAALVPDRVRLESWTETVVEVDRAGPVRSGMGPGSGVREARGAAGLMTLLAGTGGGHGHGQLGSPTKTNVETWVRTRARVHVEGVRIAAHDVAYYVHYKGARLWGGRVPCAAYEDEGLVSVEVGSVGPGAEAVRTGLNVDIELEFDGGRSEGQGTVGWWAEWFTSDSDPEAQGEAAPLFRVTDVRVDVPGLEVRLARTRHWLLNALVVQPLAGPAMRLAVGWVLRGQIRSGLEAAAALGGRVKARASEKAKARAIGGGADAAATLKEWWEALAEELGSTAPDEGESDGLDGDGGEGRDGPEDAALVETHTRVGVQGVVRKTVVQPPGGPNGEPEQESVLAVGIGAQVLPGKGGPFGAEHPPARAFEGGLEGLQTRAAEEAREAVEDVAQVERRVEEEVQEGIESVQVLRDEANEAASRAQLRTRVEGKREGWRSKAFDVLL